jgi:hypothetical protein
MYSSSDFGAATNSELGIGFEREIASGLVARFLRWAPQLSARFEFGLETR